MRFNSKTLEMELTLDKALLKGVEAHKAGNATEADHYYTAILKANPKHPDANHNMGVLAVGVGKIETALHFFKTAIEADPKIEQYWLSYIDSLIKLDRLAEAKAVFDQAKSKGAKGDRFDHIEKRLVESEKATEVDVTSKKSQEPSQEQMQSLINLYTQGQHHEALIGAQKLLTYVSRSATLYNIIGAANQGLGQLDQAIHAYDKALSIKPDYADAYNNKGLSFQQQGKLEEAIQAYDKALSIKPDYADAYYNMGNALQNQGKLKEAIQAFNKALNIKPDYADAYNNMGNALQEQGKLEEAIQAFNKALNIKPDYADAYYNMGNALHNQGKLDEAVRIYNKALSIRPEYAEVHRNLSTIKKYTVNDAQFLQVQKYYSQRDLREDTICHFSFALAKMYEDIGDMDKSFACLTKGNSLRKQLLNYSVDQDKSIFSKLKITQPYLLKNALGIKENSTDPTPIFIIGMPRSGTTLVEQIISSHSEVVGAGELNHIFQLGFNLSTDPKCINTVAVTEFRKKYLSELSKLSNGKSIVTDKMPHNFRFIPLICTAFPEAKIVHLQRNAAATCWSNFKQYFVSNSLGYCYDLNDLVTYYDLYRDLIKFWQSHYGGRIYNLNYESLTTDQENQTKKLISHLELNWQEACLSPHKNKRSVRTASQQQVRQKVYKGSSEAWRKYEPFLNGAFDSLISS